MKQIELLLANARDYEKKHALGELPKRPRRKVAVVACMDARMSVYRLLASALKATLVAFNATRVALRAAAHATASAGVRRRRGAGAWGGRAG